MKQPSIPGCTAPAHYAGAEPVDVLMGRDQLCEVLDRCLAVSQYLLERAPSWLGEG